MDTNVRDALIGFGSGVGLTVVGAIATAWVQTARQERRRVREAETEIYHRLMMLRTLWWSMVMNDGRTDRVDATTRRTIHDAAWHLSDILRAVDRVKDLEDIIRILFGEEYATAYDRYKDMDRVIECLGRKVNPKYTEAWQGIARMNLQRGMQDPERPFSAPTALL